MKETIINIKGMVCNGCENRVKNALKNINGVENVIADHNTGKVTITSNEDVSENVMKEKIEDIGFEVVKED
jgi:Cu2+-exporting ATPase